MMPKTFIFLCISLCSFGFLAFCQVGDAQDGHDHVTLLYGVDPNIKLLMKGRSGNLELSASNTEKEGQAEVDYQKGSGFVSYDREKQMMEWRTKIPFTFNHLSKKVVRDAPYMKAFIPRAAQLDFNLDMTDLGYGTMNFRDLNVNKFDLDVEYGDVDVAFPTVNKSIVRGTAKFQLRMGDLELNDLGNLKAHKIKVNGGIGELSVDFGPKIHVDTEAKIDHDIGQTDLTLPKGTHVIIRGTTRDLSQFGFEKRDRYWEVSDFHPNSPTLRIRLTGPLGELAIKWK